MKTNKNILHQLQNITIRLNRALYRINTLLLGALNIILKEKR